MRPKTARAAKIEEMRIFVEFMTTSLLDSGRNIEGNAMLPRSTVLTPPDSIRQLVTTNYCAGGKPAF